MLATRASLITASYPPPLPIISYQHIQFYEDVGMVDMAQRGQSCVVWKQDSLGAVSVGSSCWLTRVCDCCFSALRCRAWHGACFSLFRLTLPLGLLPTPSSHHTHITTRTTTKRATALSFSWIRRSSSKHQPQRQARTGSQGQVQRGGQVVKSSSCQRPCPACRFTSHFYSAVP